jgi:phospholipase/carboxylesterase
VARPILLTYLQDALRQRNLTPADLTLVGFSQGGMLALEMMFALPGLRGLICYSGAFYPPVATMLQDPRPEVLLVHGDVDLVVPYEAFTEAQRNLKKFGLHLHTLTCSGLGHSIDEEGLKVGGEFLLNLFGQEQPVIYMKQE